MWSPMLENASKALRQGKLQVVVFSPMKNQFLQGVPAPKFQLSCTLTLLVRTLYEDPRLHL